MTYTICYIDNGTNYSISTTNLQDALDRLEGYFLVSITDKNGNQLPLTNY